eukprot:TRINITY_DN7860_c0_g1_i1.p1 TRINITY_DN7860_c0_g1~~TRINITY_DN7860_c0_g1_i1.p1  ORF type:complete len:142 (-),score=80.55 TRINITY_DN7860_c0_g1_i1:248-634(-)
MSMSSSPYQEEELKPDAEASRVIADSDLINIDIKELNKMLKERGVPKDLAVRLKQRRRTLKNRNYASSCREKKDEEIIGLERLKGQEVDEVDRMEEENKRIKEEIEQMERKYSRIVEFARENNLDVVT